MSGEGLDDPSGWEKPREASQSGCGVALGPIYSEWMAPRAREFHDGAQVLALVGLSRWAGWLGTEPARFVCRGMAPCRGMCGDSGGLRRWIDRLAGYPLVRTT